MVFKIISASVPCQMSVLLAMCAYARVVDFPSVELKDVLLLPSHRNHNLSRMGKQEETSH
jgi:hypothetical protein